MLLGSVMVVVVTMLFWSGVVVASSVSLGSVMVVVVTMLFWSVVVVIAAALLGP